MGNRVKVKYLLFLIAFVYGLWWVGKIYPNPPHPPCDFLAIKIDVPLKLVEATTADGRQHSLLTRFFHNKPLFYGVNFSRCYFQYFDLPFLLSLLSFPGLIFFLWGIYFLVGRRQNDVLPVHGRTEFPTKGRGLLFLPASSPSMEGRSIRRRKNKAAKIFISFLLIAPLLSIFGSFGKDIAMAQFLAVLGLLSIYGWRLLISAIF